MLFLYQNMEHIPVLLNEAIEYLNIKKDGIYVDMTLGGGGHSSRILEKLGGTGHLYSFDIDDNSIAFATEKIEPQNNFTIVKSNFRNVKEELYKLGIEKVDGILYDLGVSSFDFDDSSRGFSYNHNAKLDMRMDTSRKFSAYDIVNKYDEARLSSIIYRYGDEKFSRQIARNIVKHRPVETTFELVDIIKASIPDKFLKGKGHPAKKTFQALRIETNDELNALEESLESAISILGSGARIVVIDFQPLEDEIVQKVFKKYYRFENTGNLPTMEEPLLKRITKKPIIPTDKEIVENNRSHSAKMRVVELNR